MYIFFAQQASILFVFLYTKTYTTACANISN